MHFYTSVNNHYMAKAIVLAKSVKKYHPEANFSLVLSDKLLDDFDVAASPFDEVITIDNLGIPVSNLNQWIFEHTIVELCTAVKGQALVNFLENGADKVIYLDPDIEVFDELKHLDELLDENDILLTPHQTIQEDCYRDIVNNEICSLMHGVYNFGFYAVRNNANGMKFAKWWRDRLLDFCYDDIPHGIFTDQKWGDLVPALFDGVHIIKSPAYNVSTWNLSHRKITKKNGRFFVNGEPLQFYHFSGFDSGAQKTMLELYAEKGSAAYTLRDMYIEKQNEAGQKRYVKYASIYDCFDNGERITNEHRKMMRERSDVHEFFKDVDPYVVEQKKSYYKWFLDEKAGKHFSLKRAVKKNCPEPMLNMLRQAKNLIAKR